MKNKLLLLLSLFLLVPATSQCMKKAIIIKLKLKTMQEIQNDRDNIIKKSLADCSDNPLNEAIFLTNWPCQNTWLLQSYCNYTTDQHYSFLGLTTIAILNDMFPDPISFIEKEGRIQGLLKLGFKPTPGDKKFALLEKKERCTPPIIKKICTLQRSELLSEMPQDIINYISLLMFETEESLL